MLLGEDWSSPSMEMVLSGTFTKLVTRAVILGLSLIVIGAAAASVNTLLTSLLVRRLVRLVTADVARYFLLTP